MELIRNQGGRVTCINPLASIWDGALHLPVTAIMHSPFCDLQQDPEAPYLNVSRDIQVLQSHLEVQSASQVTENFAGPKFQPSIGF